MIKKIFSHTAIYSGVPLIPKVASILALPILTQDLTEVDFGVRGVLMSYIGVLLIFQELGFSVLFLTSFFERDRKWKLLWRKYHGDLLIWSFFFAILLASFIWLISPKEVGERLPFIILLVCVPQVLFSNTIRMGERYYRFAQRPWDLTLISIVTGFFTVFMNLLTISYFHLGFLGWFISDFLRNFLAFALYSIPIYYRLKITPFFRFDFEKIRAQFRRALPMIPYFSSGQILNAGDRIVLDQLNVGIGEVGHYNLAGQLTKNFNILSKGYSKAAKPFFFKAFSNKDLEEEKGILRICKITQLIFLGLCSLSALWIKELMHLLIRNDFVDSAYPLAAILLMSFTYRPFYLFFVNKMIARGQDHHLWKLTAIAGVSNILINLSLIPFFGVIIAPISTFISMMLLGFLGFYFQAYEKVAKVKFNILIWPLTLILATILVYASIDFDLMVKVWFSLGIIASLLYIFFIYRRILLQIWKLN